MEHFTTFYLDKERDIEINLYKEYLALDKQVPENLRPQMAQMVPKDELTYIIQTPNHSTGNLITNLARICGVETEKNEKDMKIITGTIPASINAKNEDVYMFKLGDYHIANIFDDKGVQINGQIPAIAKTLMSQTKDYRFPIEKTIVKSFILKRLKFRTDLHTHMNANLSPDALIALGIKHQIRYPLYYIKKFNLKLSKEQEENLLKQREEVAKTIKDTDLDEKHLNRKIDDNTFINFADFILNNLENAKENIEKIRRSLAILKDGQAVFTNLEKLYLYRYVFAKGVESSIKLDLEQELDKIEKIPVKEVKTIVLKMLKDLNDDFYKNNTLRQDKLLWIAREYQKQGIQYVEIADTTLTKPGLPSIELLEDIHKMMPHIEAETGVKLRFLVAIRRIPLTIVDDNNNSIDYLRENLNVLKAVSISPYVVGCDFIGEEINDISELQPIIKEIVQYAVNEDKGYTIRIHAGENDSLKDNVSNSIKCVRESLKQGQQMPKVRIGHGLYTKDLDSEEGQQLIQEIKESGAIMEFQITSNIRLNNLSRISNHPLKKYLKNDVKCVQGTDGCGAYGIDTIDEQLALQNILGLTEKDFEKMRQVEDEVMSQADEYFEEKRKKFEEIIKGKTIEKVILDLEEKYEKENKDKEIMWRVTDKVSSVENLENMIKPLPLNKVPIIIAGGSFNARGIHTNVDDGGRYILEKLVKNANPETSYFVIGHSIRGYEKEIIDICKEQHKDFEIYAIIPKMVRKEVMTRILNSGITGVAISIESESSGIYKSFNYEIFEKINSIVIAFDGNSPVSNLIQEAKNGKAKAAIYLNNENETLAQKAKTLEGYVVPFELDDDIVRKIIKDNPEIAI